MKYEYKSIWDDNTNEIPKYNNLNNNISTDVCVIGGGIAGVSIGYSLSKNNVDFVLLEKDNICDNTTKFSTAKITSQHNLIYSDILKKFDFKKAKLYLEANNNALQNIEKIIQEENIDCEYIKQDSFVFTNDLLYKQNIDEEYQALKILNYEDVELVSNVDIPFDIKYAIKFKNQAMFNPKKYVISLANIINKHIFENCHVKKIKRKNGYYEIQTDTNTVVCNKVILATHFPIKDIPGFHFLKMYQNTSYVIVADIGKNSFNGMYINVEKPTLSFRSLKLNNSNILLVGGNNIKTGDVVNENKFTILENKAKEIYPDCKIIKRWDTQDCITLDKIPYIGKFSCFLPNFYIATGFNKWGMTTSNVAANIITDMILNRKNKYEEVFRATRFYVIKNIKELYFNLNQVFRSLIINKLKVKKDEIENIPINTGKVIKINNVNVGIYKDNDGKIYRINPYCSHLKCLLTFNIQDKTWDCPCHGSRFDIHGNLLNGPANENIENK